MFNNPPNGFLQRLVKTERHKRHEFPPRQIILARNIIVNGNFQTFLDPLLKPIDVK